jgi:hypothetical protein
MGVGLATAAAIAIPLDRRVALLMLARGAADRTGLPNAALAQDFNQRFACSARSAVFHHPSDEPLVGVELPPERTREMRFSHDPEDFIWPEAPPDA